MLTAFNFDFDPIGASNMIMNDTYIAGTGIKYISEMDEVITTVGGHCATVDEALDAFRLDIGNVRKDIMELYL